MKHYQVRFTEGELDKLDDALREYGDNKVPTEAMLNDTLQHVRGALGDKAPEHIKKLLDERPDGHAEIERGVRAAWQSARDEATAKNRAALVLRARIAEALSNPQEFSVEAPTNE